MGNLTFYSLARVILAVYIVGTSVNGSDIEGSVFRDWLEALSRVNPRICLVRELTRNNTSSPASTVSSFGLGMPCEK